MNDGKKVKVLCIVDQNHERSVAVLDHFRNFTGIDFVDSGVQHRKCGGNTQSGKRKLLFEIKKGKSKTKKFLKITRYRLSDEQEPSVQSAE